MPIREGSARLRRPSPDPDEDFDGPPRREVHRKAKFDRESDDEDLYGPPPVAPRRERRDGGSRGKSIRFEDEDEYSRTKGLRARADDDYDDPSYSGSPSRRDGNSKWVPQAEYDELSALCDNLLKQQEDMQSELAKATSAKGRGKAGPTVRGVGPNGARAKSQQQPHRERSKLGGAPAFGSSRPRSIQANERPGPTAPAPRRKRQEQRRTGQIAGVPKVAFGRAISATKSKLPRRHPVSLIQSNASWQR